MGPNKEANDLLSVLVLSCATAKIVLVLTPTNTLQPVTPDSPHDIVCASVFSPILKKTAVILMFIRCQPRPMQTQSLYLYVILTELVVVCIIMGFCAKSIFNMCNKRQVAPLYLTVAGVDNLISISAALQAFVEQQNT